MKVNGPAVRGAYGMTGPIGGTSLLYVTVTVQTGLMRMVMQNTKSGKIHVR